jgi:hypothetical protein
VAVKTTRTIGDGDPGAEGEHHALVEHSVSEVEQCHQIRLVIIDDIPYLARQLSVFYR